MSFQRTATILILSGVLIVTFQNCSEGLRVDEMGAYGLSSTQSLSPGFSSGEPFDVTVLPKRSQMLDVQLTELEYASSTSIRSVAISKNGLGFVKISDRGTQADVDQMALEGCVALSGGLPCLILAQGANFVVGRDDLEFPFPYEIPKTQVLGTDSVPFVHPLDRAQLLDDYMRALSPKALAVGIDGSSHFISHQVGYPITSDGEAQRLALERCEMIALMAPCTLVAANSTPVFDVQNMNDRPLIRYVGNRIGTSIPGMREEDFNDFISEYLSFMNQVSARGSIYVVANGAWGAAYSTDPNTNVANRAETDCKNSGVDLNQYTCLPYAQDGNIVATPELFLESLKKQSLDMHCKVIPRFDCSAHQAMGCPVPGVYYTTRAGFVQTEGCQ